MIHIICDKASPQQIKEMLENLDSYIKLAVDVKREIVAGGGILHADCEAMLLENGSKQQHVWGADWIPDTRQVLFEALINIRPKDGNNSMDIQSMELREEIEKIARRLLEI